MLNSPEPSDNVVRAAPVSRFLADTAAFGITAPCESRIVPSILPTTVWPTVCGPFKNTNAPATSTATRNRAFWTFLTIVHLGPQVSRPEYIYVSKKGERSEL